MPRELPTELVRGHEPRLSTEEVQFGGERADWQSRRELAPFDLVVWEDAHG